MKTKYIIGPSHIHRNYIKQIDDEIKNGLLFDNCILDSYRGIPIWSQHIYNSINENYADSQVYWIVSDYKFNNRDYDKILQMQNTDELFIDTIGHPGNVFKEFLERRHIELLGTHSLKVIDFILSKFPNIKLIFWCLYKRTKANKNSSYPKYLWYDVIKEKYKNNIIDIDLFVTPEDFNSKTLDKGGHPNKSGYVLLNDMINSV